MGNTQSKMKKKKGRSKGKKVEAIIVKPSPKSYAPGPRSVKVGAIPDKMYVTLKYNDRYTISPAAGALGVRRFSCNSLHDPDLTGGGHQPLYYDQLVNTLEGNGLYHKYMVNEVSYSIKLVNSSTNTEVSVTVLPTTHGNEVTSADDPDAINENPYARRKILGVNTAGKNQCTFNGKVNIKKLEGVQNLDRSAYQSVYGAPPNFQPQLNIMTTSMSENAAHTVYADVTLWYKAELFDRIFRSSTN